MLFDLIAFDADDTLWHNETLYHAARAKFEQIMAPYSSPEDAALWLDRVEMRNLEPFGYGIKPFILSMIETAVELTEGRIAGSDIQTFDPYEKKYRAKAGNAEIKAACKQISSIEEPKERIKALEREVRELRQVNEILRKASAYFAQAELDRPLKR